jgi:hypothetical protein
MQLPTGSTGAHIAVDTVVHSSSTAHILLIDLLIVRHSPLCSKFPWLIASESRFSDPTTAPQVSESPSRGKR